MRVGFLTAVLTASILSSAADAAIVEEFKAQDWDGMAFTSDETGLFTHCSVFASYRNGSTLFISYEREATWYLSVSNDSWSLTEGENYDIKFKIDRRGEIEGTGGALAADQIGLPIEADHPFIGQLRRGNQLTITFQGEDYAFELSNSNRAMNAAQDCVRRHVAADTRTPVKSGEPEEPAAEPNSDSAATDDSTIAPAGEELNFGPWMVSATEDGTGKFVNCTAYGSHGDDQLILSYFSDGIWTFGLYRAGWNLDTNQTYYLWYNVDSPADAAGVTKRPVEAVTATRIFFEVSELEDIIEKMEAGATLNIQFRGLTGDAENFGYPLDQTKEAFNATRECVAGHSSETVRKEGEEETPSSGESSEPKALPILGTKVLEQYEVPGWKAAAFALDDGTFTHCAIEAEYQNGATLGVALTVDDELLLIVNHADWWLTSNYWYPINFTLVADPPYSHSGQAQTVDATVLATRIGSYADFGATLEAAREIRVTAEGKDFSFDTSDIGPAVEELDWCIIGGPAAPEDPPAAKKAPVTEPNTESSSSADAGGEQPADGSDALPSRGEDVASVEAPVATLDSRIEAAGYTTALLLRSGYPNHVILGADVTVPESVPPGDAAWQLLGVTGSTKIVPTGSPDDIKNGINESMRSKCEGAPRVEQSDPTHMYFTLKCKASDPTSTHFLVVPRDGGGSYLFAFAGTVDDIEPSLIATVVYGKALGG